ncbi:hypothetical protein C8Q70DRAFT_1107231 [Cubamyces menziesii]|nr:hypothetical protein C8Q70DRAFT_1107231 [Cubamyces menziesii]
MAVYPGILASNSISHKGACLDFLRRLRPPSFLSTRIYSTGAMKSQRNALALGLPMMTHPVRGRQIMNPSRAALLLVPIFITVLTCTSGGLARPIPLFAPSISKLDGSSVWTAGSVYGTHRAQYLSEPSHTLLGDAPAQAQSAVFTVDNPIHRILVPSVPPADLAEVFAISPLGSTGPSERVSASSTPPATSSKGFLRMPSKEFLQFLAGLLLGALLFRPVVCLTRNTLLAMAARRNGSQSTLLPTTARTGEDDTDADADADAPRYGST